MREHKRTLGLLKTHNFCLVVPLLKSTTLHEHNQYIIRSTGLHVWKGEVGRIQF